MACVKRDRITSQDSICKALALECCADMRIAMDIREACRVQRTGKGQWAHGCLRALLAKGVRVIGYTDTAVPQEFLSERGLDVRLIPVRGFRWHFQVASALKRSRDVSCYVSPTSYIVPMLLRGRVPTLPIVHDLIAFRDASHESRASIIERFTLRRALKYAAHVCTVSLATKRDLLSQFAFLHARDVTPIYAGSDRDAPSQSSPDGRTILCVATLCPRKNQLRLIKAYQGLDRSLRERFRLVLAGGRGWGDADIVGAAAATQGVEWRGYVDVAEYESLLHTCTCFALPSLYEGFGLQILDALKRGVPLLVSDRGSIREVCEDAAVYVDPENVSSITDGLASLLTDAHLREGLRHKALEQAKTFTWERTIDRLLPILERFS